MDDDDSLAGVADMMASILHGQVSERVAMVSKEAVLYFHSMSIPKHENSKKYQLHKLTCSFGEHL